MTNYNQINKYHTIFLFLLSLSFLILKIDFQVKNITFVCFFLIATIGVSHGSLDNFKGAKLLKILNIKNKLIFYFIYIFVVLVVIGTWLIFPFFMLAVFLIVAAYHFGKEDSVFGKINKFKLINLLLFLKGSLIILAPLYFHNLETVQIFEILEVKLNQYNSRLIIVLIYLSLISNFFINKNILLSLLDSFTVYFCFLHSIRHSLSLIQDMNNKNLIKSLISFLKKALPLTIITAFGFLIAVFLLNEYYLLDSAILKVVFIGLASLTFPHILLEYLLEKNEK